MRSHGWGGRPPTDADEARARILTATRARLTAAGTTSTSEIADVLGVTRQTVYRYFPTTEDLLDAAATGRGRRPDRTELVEHVVDHLADRSAMPATPWWRSSPTSTSTCATTRP